MIVHLGTQIQVMLGRLDENGNVIQKPPVTMELPELTEQGFLKAFQHAFKERERLASELNGSEEKQEMQEEINAKRD